MIDLHDNFERSSADTVRMALIDLISSYINVIYKIDNMNNTIKYELNYFELDNRVEDYSHAGVNDWNLERHSRMEKRLLDKNIKIFRTWGICNSKYILNLLVSMHIKPRLGEILRWFQYESILLNQLIEQDTQQVEAVKKSIIDIKKLESLLTVNARQKLFIVLFPFIVPFITHAIKLYNALPQYRWMFQGMGRLTSVVIVSTLLWLYGLIIINFHCKRWLFRESDIYHKEQYLFNRMGQISRPKEIPWDYILRLFAMPYFTVFQFYPLLSSGFGSLISVHDVPIAVFFLFMAILTTVITCFYSYAMVVGLRGRYKGNNR